MPDPLPAGVTRWRRHSYRRVMTRYERRIDVYGGLVHLAGAFLCLKRLVKEPLAHTDGAGDILHFPRLYAFGR